MEMKDVPELNLPRDRITMNAWNRNFFDTNPIVRNAITFHSTASISNLEITCKNNKVEQFFNDLADRIGLFDLISNTAIEFYKMGEVFLYAELDKNNATWEKVFIQNPDYVVVKGDLRYGNKTICLRADELLKKIITSNKPHDVELRSQIPADVQNYIQNNEPILLDKLNISHLKMLSSPYDIRGTSMIVSCFKDLLLYDKLMSGLGVSTKESDLAFIRENLCMGLMIPKSNASVDLTRYIVFRNLLKRWLEKKIFTPIAQLQGFLEYSDGKQVSIIPKISWNN